MRGQEAGLLTLFATGCVVLVPHEGSGERISRVGLAEHIESSFPMRGQEIVTSGYRSPEHNTPRVTGFRSEAIVARPGTDWSS